MNVYLLDTDTCVYFLNGRPSVVERCAQVGASNLRLCDASLAELYFGAYNSQKVQENLARLESLGHLTCFSTDALVAETFGQVKADLRKRGEIIGDFDILIASFALVHGCTLVTNNVRHFGRITGLQIENWA
jgi:tRNA(fMet)-specific endonuclease VapC